MVEQRIRMSLLPSLITTSEETVIEDPSDIINKDLKYGKQFNGI